MSDGEMKNTESYNGDDEPVNPRAHKNLLQAISSLGKAQHIKRTTRNESEKQPDEFQLIKSAYTAPSDPTAEPVHPVGINDIVQILKGTSKHVKIGKNLKNVASSAQVVPVPLEKPAADRIKRTIGYDNVKEKLARWDAVVAKNRSSETQIFPLPTETVYINTSAYAKPVRLSVKSDLAREMAETDAKLETLRRQRTGGSDTKDPQQEEAEEMDVLKKTLTRDELVARRKELAYLRIRESQKSAKARMQNKIKSKKFHKLQKRQKMQAQIKEFELLQKTNPEAALEKLSQLEKNRVLERANLRHKNTGTWAKNLQIRAKYDKDVRKDLSEQLQISRQLTQKKHESDDEADGVGIETEVKTVKESADDVLMANDPFNPWTQAQKQEAKEALNTANAATYRKYWMERNNNEKLMAEFKQTTASKIEDEQEETEQKPLLKSITKPTVSKKAKSKKNKKPKIENGWVVEEVDTQAEQKLNAINIDNIFDEEEDRVQNKINKKLKVLSKEAKRLSKVKSKEKKKSTTKKSKDELKLLADLTFKTTHKRPILDEVLNGDEDEIETSKRLKATAVTADDTKLKTSSVTEHHADVIDPNQIAPIKLKQFITSISPLEDAEYGDDAEDPNEDHLTAHQMTISQAFVDDDIIADFGKDKSEKSKVVDDEVVLSMPGWGFWAGAGISQEHKAKNKNKRMVLKLAPAEKRRDKNKVTVYINEEASKHLRAHLVSDIPFPFTSLQDYEASIRAPIGRNFVPETAFRMLTRPGVIVRKGAIIEPMNENELIKRESSKRLNVVDKRIQRAALK